MKGSRKPGILKYLSSLIPSSFFPKSKCYWLLLCSCLPILVGTSATFPVAAEEQIVQVVSGGSVSRPTLRVGSQGDAVSELQAALKLLGYYNGVVDGNYTEQTASSVSQFQKEVGLSPDGVAGSTTWQKLFPGSPVVSSSPPSPPSPPTSTRRNTTASEFPVPTQSGSIPTATSGREPRPTTRTTVVSTNSNTEPKPTSRTTNASNTEPKPTSRTTNNTSSSTSRTTTRATTRVNSVTSGPEPKPTTPNRNRNPQQQSSRTSQSTTQSNTRSQQGTRSTQTMRQSNRTTSSGTRSTQTNNSSQTTQQSPRTGKNPNIQYTSEGMPILRLGMQGEEVLQLQRRLVRLGFFKGPADGDFGAATETAVKALQEKYGIEPDGVVGGGTWRYLMPRRQQQRSST
ncbi:MAG: hypothetical protein HC908_13470 [Calothrix sp. SM1_7_51]|nr:hypothetical protein [Calothrix sp. SM1_7_51]